MKFKVIPASEDSNPRLVITLGSEDDADVFFEQGTSRFEFPFEKMEIDDARRELDSFVEKARVA